MDYSPYLLGFSIGIFVAILVAVVYASLPKPDRSVGKRLRKHFPKAKDGEAEVIERRYPARIRSDVQLAIDALADDDFRLEEFMGMQCQDSYQALTLAGSLRWAAHPQLDTPAYEDVNIGEGRIVRVARAGLWLGYHGEQPIAVLISHMLTPFDAGFTLIHVQAYNTSEGIKSAKVTIDRLEKLIAQSPSYRGKILSLETVGENYRGQATGIRVHHLRPVERDEVILPEKTLRLLERNIIQFTRNRDELVKFGQSVKKGLLFYGPPGTGKTHTIHYLTRALAGHTTLIISADQVKQLGEYMTLARLLQPSIVLLEDVDLIARDRSQMFSPEQESMLNRLLNEMDGLNEEAAIIFILTTNRPESLEGALASRPGRIDQAISFPLPDELGRAKLVRLYSQSMSLSEEVIAEIVRRTDGVSASFIKELMRRSVQFHLEHNGSDTVSRADIDAALDEMLFQGGELNLKLLGATKRIGYQAGTS